MRRARTVMAVAVGLLVALGLGGCQEPAPTQVVELQQLPDYAYRSAGALKGYQTAVAEKELLSKLPCYCGCGQDREQYRNLLDCFLDQEGGFRSHGANCQVCLEEAEDAAQWKAGGLTTKEIRARIDEKYRERGSPTDTPPVEGGEE